MNTNNFKVSIIVWLCLSTLIFSACEDEKDEVPVTETKSGITFTSNGTVYMDFQHFFKSEAFGFSPTTYITKALDTVRITDVVYYVTNITFTRSDGSKWNAGNYDLLDAKSPHSIQISNIPTGNYTSFSFLLGVDSINNHTLNHSEPALDPALGMSWGWSTGYIFYRLKGYHSSQNIGFSFDLGGDRDLRTISFDLQGYKIAKSPVSIKMKADMNEFFESPNSYNLKTQVNAIHTPNEPEIILLMDNIGNGMFSLTSVE